MLDALFAPPDQSLVEPRRSVSEIDLADGFRRLRSLDPYRLNGRVTQLIGLVVESKGPEASIGERCEILTPGHRTGSRRSRRRSSASARGARC